MKAMLLLLSAASALAFGIHAGAQSSTPPITQALQSSIAAMLGKASVQDVTINGTAESIAGATDESGPVVFRATAPGSTRIDLNLPSGMVSETRQMSAGEPSGTWSKAGGAPQALAQHNLWVGAASPFPAFVLQQLLGDNSMVISYAGEDGTLLHFSASEQPAGVAAAVVRTMGQLTATDIWLDSTTLLPAKITFNTHPDNNAYLDIPVIVEYSGYQTLGGLLVPSHVQKFINNTLALDLKIQSVSFNSGLTASVFTLQ